MRIPHSKRFYKLNYCYLLLRSYFCGMRNPCAIPRAGSAFRRSMNQPLLYFHEIGSFVSTKFLSIATWVIKFVFESYTKEKSKHTTYFHFKFQGIQKNGTREEDFLWKYITCYLLYIYVYI